MNGECRGRYGHVFVLLLCAASLSGCMSIRESHFFKTDVSGETPNYYRVTIKGNSGLSSARYVSGFFEEEVVNQYFNEFGQPKNGQLLPIASTGSSSGSGSTSTAQAGGDPAAQQRPSLVLLLSNNADEVAAQMNAMAQNQQETAALIRILAGSRFEAAEQAERQLDRTKARGKVLTSNGDQLIAGLADDATQQEVKTNVLLFVNKLAQDLGAEQNFTTLDQASQWLHDNRSRLLKETK